MSFLCDRDTTAIATNQPGFMNFIVIPLFKTISMVMPDCGSYLNGALENSAKWKQYDETEEDKQVYKKKDNNSSE